MEVIMLCMSCKKEIKENSEKCEHCGALLAVTDHQNSMQETASVPGHRQADAAQQAWWKYSVFADKSIARIDQILFFVYIGFAFYIPVSAILSLIIIHFVRKNDINDVYRKSGTVVIIGIAIFSMIATFIRTMNK